MRRVLEGMTASPIAKRQRVAIWFAVLCVIASASGVVAAQFIKSPAQIAAEAAPPPPTVLTAPVRFGRLVTTVVTRGTVTAGPESVVQPQAMVGASLLVVSAVVVRPGARVHPGQVVAEVSGRPAIVLRGSVPAYRDLHMGDQGRDVAQLQAALAEAGFPVGADPKGQFEAGTKHALAKLYKAVGYAPAGGSADAYLPMPEVVYVPKFPAWVSQVDANLGSRVNEPVVTISYSQPELSVYVDPADAALIRRGTPAVLTADSGAPISGKVSSVGLPEATASNGEQVKVQITPAKQLPQTWVGQDVQVSLTSASTSRKVLYVPISAITVSASGRSSVTVVSASGAQSVVPVIAGAVANGFTAVRPLRTGALARGEHVVVGVNGG